MAKTNYRARITALQPGEAVTIRGCKISIIRATASSVSRDLDRVYSVSAVKGQPITVSRVK
mgnify:FL=1